MKFRHCLPGGHPFEGGRCRLPPRPVITCSNISVDAPSGQYEAQVNDLGSSATDNCGRPSVLLSAVPGTFPVGQTTVLATAMGNAQRSAS